MDRNPFVRTPPRRNIVVSLLLAALVVMVFSPALDGEFVNWDDNTNIVSNPRITSPSIDGIISFWTSPHKGLYVPFVFSVWSLLTSASGPAFPGARVGFPDPVLYHATNLVVHWLNGVLVFLILLRLLPLLFKSKTEYFIPAVFGTLLFLFHPVQVEPVAWATGLKDLFAAFFSLLGFWLFLRIEFDRTKKIYWVFIAAFYFLALVSKPSSIVLPAILLTVWFLIEKKWLKRMWFPIALGLLALPVIWLTMGQQTASDDAFQTPLVLRPVIALDALSFYLQKLFLPITLATDYARDPERLLQGTEIYWTWILPVALFLAATLFFKKQRKVIFVSTSIFVLSVSPVLGFVYFKYQNTSTVADRYLYFALIGPAILLAWMIKKFHKPWLMIATAIILILFSVKSYFQTQVWESSITLFEHNLKRFPESNPSRSNLAVALQAEKDPPSFRIEKLFQEQIEKFPEDFQAYNGLGKHYINKKRFEEAEAIIDKSLEISSKSVKTQSLAAELALEIDDFVKAKEHLDIALELDPYAPQALYLLGNYYAHAHHDCRRAVANYKKALSYDPNLTSAHNNAGNCYAMKGAMREAFYHFTMSAKLQPDLGAPHINLARIELSRNNIEQARRHLQHAMRIDKDRAAEAESLLRKIDSK